MPIWLRRVVLGTVVVAQITFVVWSDLLIARRNREDTYHETAFDHVLQQGFFLGAVLAVVAGALLVDRQPRNRCGVVLIALGVSMSTWLSLDLRNPDFPHQPSRFYWVALLAGVALLRPLVVWLLLAWPTGRLTYGERRFVTVFGVGFFASVFLTDALAAGSVISIAEVDWLVRPLFPFRSWVVTIGVEIVVLVVVVRRFRSAARPARSLMFPVVIAATLMLAGDLSALASELMPSWRTADSHTTTFGFVVVGIDFLRFGAMPLVLLVASARRRGVRGATSTVELGAITATGSMSGVLAESLGDPTARVLYRSPIGWVDDTGGLVVGTAQDRRMTLVERDKVEVAAIEHSITARPAALESAAGTLVLLAEHQALDARTQARLRELRRVRSSVLEAEDATRRRLERDLHDGAQQQILTLALQARLVGEADTDAVAAAIRRVRDELLGLAEGVTEQVIGERGLASFLEALAAMSPIAVELSGRVPEVLDAPVAATAWFVASEAVTNATKHAAAEHVTIDVRPVGDMLVVAVRDDGCGGANPDGGGLAGLARRVRELGGQLVLNSPAGAGTSLVASLPLGFVR
jgi:signal transduction histidine kinase